MGSWSSVLRLGEPELESDLRGRRHGVVGLYEDSSARHVARRGKELLLAVHDLHLRSQRDAGQSAQRLVALALHVGDAD